MAHECPDCGMTCHCGGDIDDIVFHGTKEELGCTCCDWGDDEDDNDHEIWCATCGHLDDSEDHKPGCAFHRE